MDLPLLETRFYVPLPHPGSLARPRLLQRLQEGLNEPTRLILVSAPAGYGKTTLLSQWVAQQAPTPARSPESRFAWLSLEEADNSPLRFWTCLAAALRRACPEIGSEALQTFGGFGAPPGPAERDLLLATLLNRLVNLPPLVLVLDDYQVIHEASIHDGLSYWIEHLPPGHRLALATRADPLLPLSRLRARRQLVEVRLADLRFTSQEAELLFQHCFDLHLEAPALHTLQNSTEGWAAGLQMAGLAIRSQVDARQDSAGRQAASQEITHFIEGFSGKHYYILDYLAEEVFNRQPAQVQTFLLRTSILKRLSAGLCDALLEQPAGSQEMLERLEKANLFVTPLDTNRQWYRYHHLFADLLRVRLQQEAPGLLPALHRRASAWYEQDGQVREAVEHALAAQDWPRAARLVEQHWRTPVESGEYEVTLGWLEALPGATLHDNPALNLALCWVLWLTGQVGEIEPRLERAAAAMQELPPERKPEQAAMSSQVALFRSVLLRQRGDLPGAIAAAEQSVAWMNTPQKGSPGEHDSLVRGAAWYHLADSYRMAGAQAAADPAYARAIAILGDRSAVAVSVAYFYRVRIHQAGGRLRQAGEIAQQALQFVQRRPDPRLPPFALVYLAQADWLCERDELEDCRFYLQRALEAGRGQMNTLRYAAYLQVRLQRAAGDLAKAIPALEQAEAAMRQVDAPYLLAELAAQRARLWIELGRLAPAAAWAQAAGLEADPARVTAHPILEWLSFVRLLCAQGRYAESLRMLDALQELDPPPLEILLLKAVAHKGQGGVEAALSALELALAQAEPQGYIRLFADEGQPIAGLLALAVARRESTRRAYPLRLLAAFPTPPGEEQHTPAAIPYLIEPPTQRESDVLRLLAQGLSNQEIAQKLFVSEGTVKTHVHNLCRKLGAQSRTHALAIARELHLL